MSLNRGFPRSHRRIHTSRPQTKPSKTQRFDQPKVHERQLSRTLGTHRNAAAKGSIAHLERTVGGHGREWLSTPFFMRGSLNGGLSIFVRRQARHVTQVARSSLANTIGTALLSFEGTTLAPSSTPKRSTRRRSQVPQKPSTFRPRQMFSKTSPPSEAAYEARAAEAY